LETTGPRPTKKIIGYRLRLEAIPKCPSDDPAGIDAFMTFLDTLLVMETARMATEKLKQFLKEHNMETE
jgi:hypothetical protein